MTTSSSLTLIDLPPLAPEPKDLPRVNLLPRETLLARQVRRAQLLGLALLAAALLVIGGLYLQAIGQVTSAETELAEQQALAGELNRQKQSLRPVTTLNKQVDDARATLRETLGPEVQFSGFLASLSQFTPGDVWLTNLTATTAPVQPGPGTPGGIGSLQITGTGFSQDALAAWLEALGRQRGLTGATFSTSTAMNIGPRQFVTFSSSATLTDDARSGRYDTPSGGLE